MNKIGDLAAFDPKKLALTLQSLAEGSVVYGLGATGPWVAMPLPAPEALVVGGIYHHQDQIDVWTGGGFTPIAKLSEFDGKPILVNP